MMIIDGILTTVVTTMAVAAVVVVRWRVAVTITITVVVVITAVPVGILVRDPLVHARPGTRLLVPVRSRSSHVRPLRGCRSWRCNSGRRCRRRDYKYPWRVDGRNANDDAHARKTSPTTAAVATLSNRGGFKEIGLELFTPQEKRVGVRLDLTYSEDHTPWNHRRKPVAYPFLRFTYIRSSFSLVLITTIMAANRWKPARFQHTRLMATPVLDLGKMY